MNARAVADPAAWNALLDRLDRLGLDDIYFRPGYVNLSAKDGANGEAFVFESGDELFVMPWLVRPIDSSALTEATFDFETPYGYSGPLTTTAAPDFLAKTWKALADYCRARRIVCGLIRFHPLLNNHRWVAPGAVDLVADRETVVLDLGQDPDAIWDGYASETRNKVRKAVRKGVSVHPTTGAAALADFAELYRTHMEELGAHEDYFFGDEYFRQIESLGPDSYRVYLAKYDGITLGGALVLLSRRWAHYHLSSSLQMYAALAPNNILRHSAIMDLVGSGRERIHFGGGRTANPADSLLQFKGGYSRERALFHFGRFVGDRDVYESLCAHWARIYPHLVDRFGLRFLRYRYR